MMKDPNNRGMVEMMQKQYPGMNINSLIRVFEFLVSLSNGFRKIKSIFTNKFYYSYLE